MFINISEENKVEKCYQLKMHSVQREFVDTVYLLDEETHALYPGLQKGVSSCDVHHLHQCEM